MIKKLFSNSFCKLLDSESWSMDIYEISMKTKQKKQNQQNH